MALGISKKVILTSVAVLSLTLAATAVVSGLFFQREYAAALQSRAFMVGSILKYQMEKLLKYDIPLERLVGFEEQCQEIINNYGDISYAMVVDSHGGILFHNNPLKQGERAPFTNIPELLKRDGEMLQQDAVAGKSFYNFIIPVHGAHQAPVAAVVIGFPASLITHKAALMVAYSVGVAIIFLAVGGLSMVILLRFWVTTPLGQLLRGIDEVRGGGAGGAELLDIKSKDEFGDLGQAFNEMVHQLKESQAQLQNYMQEHFCPVKRYLEITALNH
jgi:methyl-accepting chemotaxis protein